MAAPVVGPVTDIALQGNRAVISARPATARVVFLTEDTFRVWVAFGRKFVDERDMVVDGKGRRPGAVADVGVPEFADVGAYFRLTTAAFSLRIYKERLRFGLYEPDDTTLIAEEKQPLGWDQQSGTTQYLTRGENEQYFGGGMQNGRFTHRHKAIDIAVSYNWDDGGCPNSVPFYLSSAGYGVFRHTFAPGRYVFADTVSTRHEERRYDAYWFVGGPEGTRSWATRDTGQLDLDVYPERNGAFTLYEDDGVTRRHAGGEFALQTFTMAGGEGQLQLTIGPVAGRYAGQPENRRYLVRVHRAAPPATVTADGAAVAWGHRDDFGGVTLVWTAPLAAGAGATISLR